ncbi:DUF429 domain-containing protein [Actinomycetospora lemnae]|uniref:DUF429 domain-containing protein n=1 Tax=Actinomycetospora lemnae TaxID=3019891 RepID=A0ABT5STE9_9PSEU|nr:DUF429 domain-containing protein [Actinomycetospora sp. DW7H6]MDD7966117.1 DUF429 domain-containing protein [Actinomycetospora sp. DW7H6]
MGIDLSATARGTAVVAIDWTTSAGGIQGHARLVCDSADGSAGTEALLDALEDGHKVGIDCPFGWPSSFIAAVAAHGSRGPWPTDAEPEDRRELRLRATDRHLADRYGVNALSVSSDRIGAVAMRWAALVSRHERERGHGLIDRAGRGRLVEVYPALAVGLWGLATSETAGYKRADPAALLARRALLRELTASNRVGENGGDGPVLIPDGALVAAVEHPACGDDVVDALVAALVAAAACTPGGVEGPPAPGSPQGQLAALEGWIAVPTVPLDEVAPVP